MKTKKERTLRSKDAIRAVFEKAQLYVHGAAKTDLLQSQDVDEESDDDERQFDRSDDDDNQEEEKTVPKRKATEQDLIRKREKARQNRIRKRELKKGKIKLESKKPTAAIAYLKLWHTSRSEWKFVKHLQIWLLKNLYNPDLISDENFDILLEYLTTAHGNAKTMTLEEASRRLKTYEDLSDELRENEEQTTIYERARKLLQYL